jgi:hypothetical protein
MKRIVLAGVAALMLVLVLVQPTPASAGMRQMFDALIEGVVSLVRRAEPLPNGVTHSAADELPTDLITVYGAQLVERLARECWKELRDLEARRVATSDPSSKEALALRQDLATFRTRCTDQTNKAVVDGSMTADKLSDEKVDRAIDEFIQRNTPAVTIKQPLLRTAP